MSIFFARTFLNNLETTRGHGSGTVPPRAKDGIYCGRRIGSGCNVSHSVRRTKRKWLPNVQVKKFYSDLLNEDLSIEITTHSLRCIERKGGIDSFLLFSKPKILEDSQFGQELRQRVIKAYEEKHGIKFIASQQRFLRRVNNFSLPRYSDKLKEESPSKSIEVSDDLQKE